ncbi:MAG TPA: alpha/beta hydrolase [Burkholderiales bacterium]|nr:alpha/beta hydrolase [Burkholderiales bacterium]
MAKYPYFPPQLKARMSAQTNTNAQTAPAPQPAPYQDRSIEVAGLKLHYQDFGTAGKTPMICVHGGAASGHWFDFMAADFTANYHVIGIDQRGHGDSEWAKTQDYRYERYAADLDELAAKLDLRDFVLIGHSMGGAVSLTYAALHPGRVARLVVIDTTLHMTPDRIAKLREVGTRPGRTYATREEFISRFRLRPADSSATPEVLRHLANHAAQQNADGTWGHKFDRDVYAVRESVDGLPHWSRIKIPALLVKGQRSQRITPEIQAEVTKRAPQVEFAEVEGADHHVTLDNPAGFSRAVKAFLAKH